MKVINVAVLSWCVSIFTGCGKPPNRTVTDSTDLEAIRAYEREQMGIEQEDAAFDWRAQSIAEEKAAAEDAKKAAAEAKNAAP